MVVGPGAGVEQRAGRLHAVARRHLGARQLAARADDGRRRAAHARRSTTCSSCSTSSSPTIPRPRGDFWRVQPWVEIPAASSRAPGVAIRRCATRRRSRGKRLGVPRMYINADAGGDEADRDPAIGDRALGAGPRAISKRSAPRSSRSTSRSSRTTSATGRVRGRWSTAGWCRRSSPSARSGTCRSGRGTIPAGQRRPARCTGWPTSTAR